MEELKAHQTMLAKALRQFQSTIQHFEKHDLHSLTSEEVAEDISKNSSSHYRTMQTIFCKLNAAQKEEIP